MTQNIITVTSAGSGTNPSQIPQLPQSSVTGLSVIILALSLIGLVYIAIQAKYQGKIEIMVGDDIHVNIEGSPQEKQQNLNIDRADKSLDG